MKKSLIITVGVVLILIVLAVWLYLLFFGTPKNTDDVFANLGLGNTAPVVVNTPIDDPVVDDTVTQLEIKRDALQQLTVRPVAGFTFVATSTDLIRYVERGTGYIFEIDIVDGSERRISGTTIPRVVEAVFSPDGESVALITETGYTRTIVAGIIPEEENAIDFITLPQNSFDPGFTSQHSLRYAVLTDGGTEGYELDIRDNNPVRTFSIPFREISVLWDEDVYAYNKPTRYLKGALYEVGDTLTSVTPGEFGFVGDVTDAYFVGTAIVDEAFGSYVQDRVSDERVELPIVYLPEKCAPVPTESNILWCAAALDTLEKDALEEWYQGAINSEDMLWRIDASLGEAVLTSNFFAESGRLVDVDQLTVDALGVTPVFRNKIDNTLWLYDTRIQ